MQYLEPQVPSPGEPLRAEWGRQVINWVKAQRTIGDGFTCVRGDDGVMKVLISNALPTNSVKFDFDLVVADGKVKLLAKTWLNGNGGFIFAGNNAIFIPATEVNYFLDRLTWLYVEVTKSGEDYVAEFKSAASQESQFFPVLENGAFIKIIAAVLPSGELLYCNQIDVAGRWL